MSPTKKMEINHTIAKILWPTLAVGALAYGTLVLPNKNQETTADKKTITPLQTLACASPAYRGTVAANAKGSDDWFRYEQLSNFVNKNPNSQSLTYAGSQITIAERTFLADDLNNKQKVTPGKEYTVLNLDGIIGPDGQPTLGQLFVPGSARLVPNPLLDRKTGECKYQSN